MLCTVAPIQFKLPLFEALCWFVSNNRISKEIYRQSMAGFSPIPMELYQKSEALIQPILFNLERKKRGLKARVLRSQPKLRIAFMVLLRQFRRPQCSCSVWFVTPRSGSAFERTSPQVARCLSFQTGYFVLLMTSLTRCFFLCPEAENRLIEPAECR